MKLKFRADKDDLVIFGIFAIFLLYIVCIGVVNLHSFATEGYFSTFNPFPAFSPDLIGVTLVVYICALIGMLVSVKSYFFEMEKGVGFTTEKKDKGYSRWAKDKELKAELAMVRPQDETSKAAGVPLILKDTEAWVDNGEYHTLVIGATGSGKTQTVIKPTVKFLAKAGESMIITDPKGEIYESTAEMLRDKGYDVQVLNFREPQNGTCWNPLSLPYKMYKNGNQDKAIELLDDLALNILYDESNSNADPFWEKTSADYFSGVALGLFEDAKEEEININSINLMTTVGEEKFGGSTYIKEYFSEKDPASAASINASSTIMAPTETKASILSVFKQKIKLFASRENISEMLSRSDIELADIGRKKTALFIVIQDEKKTYHSLVTILLKQCYETLIDVAQESGGKLPYRTNFILDEFANMPPLKDVTTMVTAARSRLIRFTFIIQNYAQLTQVYGKENAETIKGNCNITYLISSELGALEELSKLCGEVKSKDKDKTASTPLVTVSDLQRLQQYETISLRLRTMPFKTKLVPNWKMDWGRTYDKATYPERPRQQVQLFDIREFVKDMKKKKMAEMMGNSSSTNTGGMPNSFNANPMMGIGAGPMFGNNPFAMNNPFANHQSEASQGGFNVDDLVKRIDAKIAELEEEERIEKEKQEKEKNKTIPTTIENSTDDVEIVKPREEIIPDKINNINILNDEEDKRKTIDMSNVQEVIPVNKEEKKEVTDENKTINISELSNTNKAKVEEDDDDNFFDDFFSDE